ncbi:hypothetical protein [Agromyces laixinhei]|uniref:hypothetical protein n=1 Tax=Agromyces laixinhei TaxID=2585717 RepID=UPI00111641D1|nr:hypothetical protein [Agromyces laixinhei]
MTARTLEAIRVTNAARRSAMKARTEVIVQLKSLIVTAPEPIRAEYRDPPLGRSITRLTDSRARAGDDEIAARTCTAFKRLAARYQQLDEEIAAYDTDLAHLVDAVNPGLVQTHGIKTVTAAQLLITADWRNDDIAGCGITARDHHPESGAEDGKSCCCALWARQHHRVPALQPFRPIGHTFREAVSTASKEAPWFMLDNRLATKWLVRAEESRCRQSWVLGLGSWRSSPSLWGRSRSRLGLPRSQEAWFQGRKCGMTGRCKECRSR